MLTQEDLKNIGTEVGKVIEQNVNPALDALQGQINHIQNQMVTKDYLDEKLLDLRGDLVISMRKEDVKLSRLVELLKAKAVLNEDEAKEILSMEPFPKLAL